MADTCASVGFFAAVVVAGLGSAAGLAVVVSLLGAAAGAAAGAASVFAGSLFGAADASIAFTALWQPELRKAPYHVSTCRTFE